MTVQELRDKLDNYIKKDPDYIVQLNDVQLDKFYYQKRCIERANREVILIDDGMQPKYFKTDNCFGTTLSDNEKVFAILFDKLLGEIK
jgi:hypothetical protein